MTTAHLSDRLPDISAAVGVAFGGRDAFRGRDLTAREPLLISAGEPTPRTAQLMHEHRRTHVLVVDHAGGYPAGVLASLDLRGAREGLASDAEVDVTPHVGSPLLGPNPQTDP